MGWMDERIGRLVGKKVNRIFMNDEYLKFETDQGTVAFTVDGDCCSRSYFYDFHGVDKLLKNGPVVSARYVDLGEPDDENARRGDSVVAYGYEIVTEDPRFGEVTSVFSFRNDSNGYYGGTLENAPDDTAVETEVREDVLEVA